MEPRTRWGWAIVYALLLGGSVVFLFPLIWLVATSLKPIEQTMSMPPSFLPRAYYATIQGERREVTLDYQLADGRWYVTERSPTKVRARQMEQAVVSPDDIEVRIVPRWENYRIALRTMGGMSVEEAEGSVPPRQTGYGRDSRVPFWVFLRNTLLVCMLGVVGTVLSNAIVAYGFARISWRGRDSLFAITLATMMVPFPVLMVPLYGVFKWLGWIGTLQPLWVPAFFGSAFNIFLLRQFFRTIPAELSEAARIDGCNEWQIFWRIILPLSKPALMVVGLFHFLHSWNDFLGPLLFLTRKHTFTLAVALQSFQTQAGGVQWHDLMAPSAGVIAPHIVLFLIAQKALVRGIATTGLKG
ncbi:MAG: carbohydrate ABC transporter permease [Verrucomicrobiae bacterium]|nr:carbohydrate ABC transporter permease [Verrucomicrobiae bacterium]